ncbi:MAG: cupredoxin domain-containing protein [Gemmataceae bacterium]
MSIAALGLLAMCAWAFSPGQPKAIAQSRTEEIRVTARKYAFVPERITVKKGDRVRLLITAVDHAHGFRLDGYQINRLIKKGNTVIIEFVADKPGTFHFQCSHFCGLGHSKMHGELIVEQ